MPLLEADVIAVTEDSSSMLSDAWAARRPVVALKPSRGALGLGNEMVSALAAVRELAVLPLAALTPEMFAEAVSSVRVPDTSPRAELAAEILERLFPERLPPADRVGSASTVQAKRTSRIS
jgi:hypothetical protein